MFDYLEYSTKIDSYYYNPKLSTTVVVLKIRNKRTVYHLALQELLQNQTALSSLHPMDLCIIGALASALSNPIQNLKDKPVAVQDNFLMEKMAPILEVVGNDYSSGKEVLTLRLKPLNRTIQTTANELYNDKNLMNALRYQDALSLGYSVEQPAKFFKEKIIRTHNEYSFGLCIYFGLFLSTLILSVFLIGRSIKLPTLGQQIEINGEILLLPFLFFMQNIFLEKYDGINSDKFFAATISSLIILLIYFACITSLPYPAHDSNATAFNTLYQFIISRSPDYILSFITAIIINIYTRPLLNRYLVNMKIFTSIMINNFYISLFFINSFIFCVILGQNNYSLINYFYSILLTALLSLAAIVVVP